MKLLVLIASLGFGVSVHASTKCKTHALQELKRLDPYGYGIYSQQKTFFNSWWDCTDFVSDLDTAVHETIHYITAERDAHPLLDGTLTPLVPETRVFFPPSEISPQIDRTMDHAFYIVDKHQEDEPSSVHELRYLLDELNAYAQGLETTNHMMSVKTGVDDSRDGVMAMMHYVDLYVQRAKTVHPKTWAALNQSPVKETIQKLWTQAETVGAEACRLKVPGMQDTYYIKRLCAPGHDAMQILLGRELVCLSECLKN